MHACLLPVLMPTCHLHSSAPRLCSTQQKLPLAVGKTKPTSKHTSAFYLAGAHNWARRAHELYSRFYDAWDAQEVVGRPLHAPDFIDFRLYAPSKQEVAELGFSPNEAERILESFVVPTQL